MCVCWLRLSRVSRYSIPPRSDAADGAPRFTENATVTCEVLLFHPRLHFESSTQVRQLLQEKLKSAGVAESDE